MGQRGRDLIMTITFFACVGHMLPEFRAKLVVKSNEHYAGYILGKLLLRLDDHFVVFSK